jgi:hypothetical protein
MELDEFEQKWDRRLEQGFYGLAIDDPKVIELVDKRFTEWEEKYPSFSFSQIKMKFGSSRVYCDGVPYEETSQLEKDINNIYHETSI